MTITHHSLIEIMPIGGVGEIGSNMTLVTIDNKKILIDCGILFPDNDQYNIRYLIPDYKNLPPIDHIIITHGHEDHIGAIIHLVDHLPKIQIYCTEFARELMIRKFTFLNKALPKFEKINLNSQISIGHFNIDFIHVNHSIPQTMGVLFTSSQHSLALFYASDFKVDFNSPYEKPFDFEKLKKLTSSMKKRLFFCDSTNITSSMHQTLSENDLIPEISHIISKASGRVFVTLFSSNIHRLQTLINIAAQTGKKIILHGRAMESYIAIAKKYNLIEADQNLFISAKSHQAHALNNQLILVSGCQGDFRSALNRIATDNDAYFELGPQDTFLFSSKAIPGNEKKIAKVLNRLTEKGVTIFTPDNALIHASGHPGQDDLLKTYREYSPSHIIPIHGETFFLKRHFDFIKRSYPQATPLKLANFDILKVDQDLNITIDPGTPQDPLLIINDDIIIEQSDLSQRRKVAQSGLILFSARRDDLIKYKQNFKITFLGLPDIASQHEEFLTASLIDVLKSHKARGTMELEERIKIHIRQYAKKVIGHKPITFVHLV